MCEEHDRLQRAVDGLAVDLQNCEVSLRAERRKSKALRNQIDALARSDDRNAAVARVLEAWRERCDHPRSKIPMDGKRAEKVRARLNDFETDELLEAVDGAARFPYVGRGGRQRTGSAKERYDDAELIFRDETTVEKFIRLSRREKTAAAIKPEPEKRLPPYPREEPITRVLGALEARGCQWRASPQADAWMAQCPAHEDRTPSLSLRRALDGKALIRCWAGCQTEDVLAALGLDWPDLWRDERQHGERTLTPENQRALNRIQTFLIQMNETAA